MEEQEQKWDQVEVSEQEEEESAPLVRKSRTGNDTKITEFDVEASNGTSEHNGHASDSDNGAENDELTLANEQETAKLEEVLEGETQPTNGQIEPETLVFFDKDAGIWKCRICTWTYRNGSVCVDHIQNHKGQLHKLMNFKTLNVETEGVETAKYPGESQFEKDHGPDKLDILSHDIIVESNGTSGINNGYDRSLEKSSLSEILFEESDSDCKSSKEIESTNGQLITEDELEETDLDVERVLQKQTTQDLYCPNCNSCITKRVILKKRKRRIRTSDEDVKRNKLEASVDSRVGTGLVQAFTDQDEVLIGVDDARIPRADVDDDRERGPTIFRCLSCFSFFIPTGDGFKLFKNFRGRSTEEVTQAEEASKVNRNWFSSMFASNKSDAAAGQGNRIQKDLQNITAEVASSSKLSNGSSQPALPQKGLLQAHASEGVVGTAHQSNDTTGGRDQNLSFRMKEHSPNGKVIINGAGDEFDKTTEKIDVTMDQFEPYTGDQLKEYKPSQEARVSGDSDPSLASPPKRSDVTYGEPADGINSFSQQDGLKFLISSEGSLVLDDTKEGQVKNQTGKEAVLHLPSSAAVLKTSNADGKLNILLTIPHEEQPTGATILEKSVADSKNANFQSNHSGQVYPSEVSQLSKFEVHNGEILKVDTVSSGNAPIVVQGKDTVITIESRPNESSETVQGLLIHPTETAAALQSATQISIADRERTEERNEIEIEVIKSIVYGGLAESITSLSVVSSAAGGNAATLNVLALGIANLIGGLFIIFHNLWELRSDRPGQVPTQITNQITEQRDRYKELLGRRENFLLHAIVSITSYLVFGLMPPVVYGFSFRKSDDRDLKLLVVAAASLLCILVLAIGRAYVQRPPKPYLKSVITFVMLGFMVSGVSYVAGVFIERLVQKLGLFPASSPANLILPGVKTADSAWAAY